MRPCTLHLAQFWCLGSIERLQPPHLPVCQASLVLAVLRAFSNFDRKQSVPQLSNAISPVSKSALNSIEIATRLSGADRTHHARTGTQQRRQVAVHPSDAGATVSVAREGVGRPVSKTGGDDPGHCSATWLAARQAPPLAEQTHLFAMLAVSIAPTALNSPCWPLLV